MRTWKNLSLSMILLGAFAGVAGAQTKPAADTPTAAAAGNSETRLRR